MTEPAEDGALLALAPYFLLVAPRRSGRALFAAGFETLASVEVPTTDSGSARDLANGLAAAHIAFWPGSTLELDLGAGIARRPFSPDPGSTPSQGSELSPTLVGRASIGVGGSPGATFWDVRYAFRALRDENTTIANRDAHRFTLDAGWRFLPAAGLSVTAEAKLNRWTTPDPTAARSHGTLLRSLVRLEGSLGGRWHGSLEGGFGGLILEQGTGPMTGVGRLHVGVDIAGAATMALSVSREVAESVWGGAIISHEVGFAARGHFLDALAHGAFTLEATASWVHGAHPGYQPPDDGPAVTVVSHRERTEELIRASSGTWVRVAPHVWIGVDWLFRARLSRFRTQRIGETLAGIDSQFDMDAWDEHRVLGGVRVTTE